MINQLRIGEAIKQKREEMGYTQEQLAEKIDMTQRMVSSYERGKSLPSRKAAEKISKILNISLGFLLGTSNNSHPQEKIPLSSIFKKSIPVYETVSAGNGKTMLGEPIGTMQTFEGDFAVKVKGNSMPPIRDESFVIVKKVYDVRDVHDGDLVVVRINGDEAVLKYWFLEDDYGVVLKSENVDYKPRFIPFEKFYNGECELIGLAIHEFRDLRKLNYFR